MLYYVQRVVMCKKIWRVVHDFHDNDVITDNIFFAILAKLVHHVINSKRQICWTQAAKWIRAKLSHIQRRFFLNTKEFF